MKSMIVLNCLMGIIYFYYGCSCDCGFNNSIFYDEAKGDKIIKGDRMKVQVYRCKRCDDRIYSRAKYDLRSCSCGSLIVDGGHSDGINWVNERIMGETIPKPEWIVIDVTEPLLFDDWNMKRDKLGLIKGNTKRK